MTNLTADLIARIVVQEAQAAGTTPERVIHMAPDSFARKARASVFRRLARDTGASAHQLARVWGCDHSAVARYLRGVEPGAGGMIDSNYAEPPADAAPPVGAMLATFTAIDRLRSIA